MSISSTPLCTWIASATPPMIVKVSTASKHPSSNPKSKSSTKNKYAIRSQGAVVHRTLKDFMFLRSSLSRHFWTIVLPDLTKEKFPYAKNSLSLFLCFLVANPFLRHSAEMQAFLNPDVINFKKQCKKDNKKIIKCLRNQNIQESLGEHSLGLMKWEEAISDYNRDLSLKANENRTFFMDLKTELRQFIKHLRALEANARRQIKTQEAQAINYSQLNLVLTNFLATESNVCKLKSNLEQVDTKNTFQNAIDSNHAHVDYLRKQKLKKKVLDKISQEISLAQRWIKNIETTQNKIKSFAGIKSGDNLKGSKGRNYKLKQDELDHLLKGMFGIELQLYFLCRTQRVKQILNSFRDVHLEASDNLYRVWHPNQVTPKQTGENDDLPKRVAKKIEKNFYLNTKSPRSSMTFMRKKQAQENIQFKACLLEVTGENSRHGFFLKGKFLKVKIGEILVGHKQGLEYYMAINSSGERGYVSSSCVTVLDQVQEPSPTRHRKKTGVQVPESVVPPAISSRSEGALPGNLGVDLTHLKAVAIGQVENKALNGIRNDFTADLAKLDVGVSKRFELQNTQKNEILDLEDGYEAQSETDNEIVDHVVNRYPKMVVKKNSVSGSDEKSDASEMQSLFQRTLNFFGFDQFADETSGRESVQNDKMHRREENVKVAKLPCNDVLKIGSAPQARLKPVVKVSVPQKVEKPVIARQVKPINPFLMELQGASKANLKTVNKNEEHVAAKPRKPNLLEELQMKQKIGLKSAAARKLAPKPVPSGPLNLMDELKQALAEPKNNLKKPRKQKLLPKVEKQDTLADQVKAELWKRRTFIQHDDNSSTISSKF
eukprot:snap_masked-scaffold_2-processed-gene-19.24-mRNA-1 protein AED:1.00 eAED:1.00 QI:0/-1/0/0/-1/1/1/0/828